MSPDERRGISSTITLVQTEEATRKILDDLKQALDDPKRVKNWDLQKYHVQRLSKVGTDRKSPDGFFRHFGTTKSRVILRLAAKDVLQRVQQLPDKQRTKLITTYDSLPLHRQIDDRVQRSDQRIKLEGQTQSFDLQSQGELAEAMGGNASEVRNICW